MVTTTTQCLVIGGGITGLSTALYLARKGVKVTVIDRCDSLSSQLKASNVNCGIVCGAPHAGPGLGQELFGRSLEVAKKMGDDAKYVHSGSLEVLMTEAECQWGKALVEVQRGLGFGPDQIAYLTPAEARKVEPNLGNDVLGIVHFPDEGHVNPRRMTKAMGVMAKGAGADIWMSHEVEALNFQDGKYHVEVRSNLDQMSKETIVAELLVLATGAHSHHLLKPFGLTLPVIPVRGTMWSTGSLPQA